jgi:hypothetical protein
MVEDNDKNTYTPFLEKSNPFPHPNLFPPRTIKDNNMQSKRREEGTRC